MVVSVRFCMEANGHTTPAIAIFLPSTISMKQR